MFRNILFIVTALIFAFAVYAEEKGPDTIKMKKNVTFTHKKHSTEYKVSGKEIPCKECHHKGDEKKCTGCHDGTDKGGKLTMKDAAHKHCTGCHKKVKGEAKAPTKCTGACHPK